MKGKIILFASGGAWENIGDQSMLHNIIIKLRERLPNIRFHILSDNPQLTAEKAGISASYTANAFLFDSNRLWKILYHRLPRLFILLRGCGLILNAFLYREFKKTFGISKDCRKWLTDIYEADLIFESGGGTLNRVWLIGGLYSRCISYLIFKAMGKKVIISGQSIGPLYNWFDKTFLSLCLNRVDMITLRDKNFSERFLKNIGVTKPFIKSTGDDAVSLEPSRPERVKVILSKERITKHYPIIAINIRDPRKYKLLNNIADMETFLANLIDRIIEENNAKIIFVPMSYHANVDDNTTAVSIFERMRNKDKVSFIKGEYDEHDIKGIIGTADAALGLSYHFIVFAMTMGVPAIALYADDYYKIKMCGVCNIFGEDRFALNMRNDATIDKALCLTKYILQNKKELQLKLHRKTQEISKEVLLTINSAVEVVRK